ncbi:MAG: beta-lactamase family protein [Acidobacteriales bacterium]|nr:beta-lactamase family protein [Terriglobales bacterium]
MLIAVFLSSVLLTAQLLPAQIQPATAQHLDAIVDKAMKEDKIPAVSVAIALNGQIQYQKSFGRADIENDVPATPETLFRTASIAKAMTAVAAMRLVEQGKLDLDAPVQRYCPAFPQKPWPITTRQLMGHLSGIRHYSADEVGTDNTRHFAKLSDGFVIFGNDPLLFEPGTKYQYSTYGFSVVGCVLEGVTGKPYPELMQQLVFIPSHMTHTVVDDVFEIVPHRARGYSIRNGQIINAGLMDSSYKIPGGGYVSTPADLTALADALLAGKLLKADTLKLMWTAQKLRDGRATEVGLGWHVGKLEGEDIAGHTGGQAGASCSLTIFPVRKLVVAVMTNTDQTEGIKIDRQISAVLLKDLFAIDLDHKAATSGTSH